MRVKVQKWGNSIALRIPKSFANQTSIKLGSLVDLSIHDGKLIIEPLNQPEYDLKTLISEVKETNIHKEYLADKPKGRELW
ncbi:MAG: AbrB/MazE/SpoVT family DNA-binding domain-containing protein [Bacillota bacterium]|nr:AbrB/MazE/SpoVT family DNA-binding domain-containing protein [Bacillota bacterium]MDW7684769.1 AbrB/MazE/SpoVT family DNA-binding domain-containing protein [Bacillota bacterium]